MKTTHAPPPAFSACPDCNEPPVFNSEWSDNHQMWATVVACERCAIFAIGKADTANGSLLKAKARWEDRH